MTSCLGGADLDPLVVPSADRASSRCGLSAGRAGTGTAQEPGPPGRGRGHRPRAGAAFARALRRGGNSADDRLRAAALALVDPHRTSGRAGLGSRPGRRSTGPASKLPRTKRWSRSRASLAWQSPASRTIQPSVKPAAEGEERLGWPTGGVEIAPSRSINAALPAAHRASSRQPAHAAGNVGFTLSNRPRAGKGARVGQLAGDETALAVARTLSSPGISAPGLGEVESGAARWGREMVRWWCAAVAGSGGGSSRKRSSRIVSPRSFPKIYISSRMCGLP